MGEHSEDDKALPENKKRTVKTRAQVEALEKFFDEEQYPTEPMKEELAKSIGFTKKQVSGWLSRRRSKDRRLMYKRLKDKRLLNPEAYANDRQDRSSGIVQDRGSGFRQDSCGSTKQGDDRSFDPREVESRRLTCQESSAADINYELGSHYVPMANRGSPDDTSSGSSSSLRKMSFSQERDHFAVESSRNQTQSLPVGIKQFKPRTGPSGYLKVKGQVENADITAVKRQLGLNYRADGPPLGVEFDPLPPGAFESPITEAPSESYNTEGPFPVHSPEVSMGQRNHNPGPATSPSKGKEKGKVKAYFTWTSEMDKVLGACFVEQMNQGNKLDGKCAWKSASWTVAVNDLREKLNINVTKANIMARLKTWEKHHDILHPILVACNSGSAITWDYSNGRIEVHDENVWEEQLKANPKLAPYRRKIIVENWDDICTLFSQDRASGQGAKTIEETNIDIDLESSSNAQASFGIKETTTEDDDVISILLALQQRLKENATSSTSSKGTKRKLTSSQALYDVLGRMANSFDKYLMTETHKATTEEVLRELEKVDLDSTQMLKALDMMMHNQRLFDTFSGMPSHLRQQWILMHIRQ